jgi:molybdate transport system regulatory protein
MPILLRLVISLIEFRQKGVKMTVSSSSKKTAALPGEAYSDCIRARFWITQPGSTGYLGIGRVKLLELIREYGSINRAAKEMGMSYKRAWGLVEEMNRLAESPLVWSEKGGKSGGGTQVSELGEQCIRAFREFECRLTAFLEVESKSIEKLLASNSSVALSTEGVE